MLSVMSFPWRRIMALALDCGCGNSFAMRFWARADWEELDWPPLVLEVVTWESCWDNGKLAAKSRIQKTIISLYLLPTNAPILANVGTREP